MTPRGDEAPVLVERMEEVEVITLNRPSARNAINGAVARALDEALAHADADPAVRAVVLTGSDPVFCAGMDLKAGAAADVFAEVVHPEHGFAAITSRVMQKPLIGAVNGDAVGGGFEIVLSCDLVVAAESARFALPEVSRGLLAAAGGVARLVRQMPERIALELLLTGRFFGAEEAARWGLVNSIAPREEVLPRVLELARLVAANAPLAVAATRRIAAFGADRDAAMRASTVELETLFASGDAEEGVRAFVERRAPQWSGS